MADQKCHFCKIIEPYKYWTKLPPTEHRFLQFMGSNFQIQQKIPQKFADSKMVSEWCSLRGPSNNTWKVKVREGKNKGEKYFCEGWAKFAKDNGVEKSDILVFQCFGNSRFKVHFFDANGCEKEGTYFSTNCAAAGSTMFCKSSLHSNYKDNKYHPKMEVNQEEIPLKHKTELEDEENDFSFNRSPAPASKRAKTLDHSKSPPPSPSPSEQYAPKRKNLGSEQRAPTGAEKDNAWRLAKYQSIQSVKKGLPNFHIILKFTHVINKFCLTIPKDFAAKNLMKEYHKVKLQVAGAEGSWIVGCRYNIRPSTSPKTVFQANWKAFVLDNMLKVRDNLLFELIQAGESNGVSAIFRVHIFRAGDENVALSP